MTLKLSNLFRHIFVGVAGHSAATRGRFGLKSRMGLVSVTLASLALTACDDSGHSGDGSGGSNGSAAGSSGGGTTMTYSIGGTVSGNAAQA